ncbi:MAG: hypothetical protein V4519_02955 [Patescibacteria group bacterium]
MKHDEKRVLNIFYDMAKNVPAYKLFLKESNIKYSSIKNFQDFKKVPLVDKKNYLYKYNFQDLFDHKKIPPMVYASSGSSGRPTFWFRGDKQEQIGGRIHEQIFRKVFKIQKSDSTLVIICFSMGVWVAGNYTLEACRYVARQGYNLTTISPGIEKDDIFNVLKNLAPKFKNVVLVGYPPFVMDILKDAQVKRIPINNENIYVLTAGDKYSESWRESTLNMLDTRDKFSNIVSIYGSADAAMLGHETQLSIFIRRQSQKDRKLYLEIFGDTQPQPALVQYHPEIVYFETINDELVLTTQTAVPLIRYNIHDLGTIFTFNHIQKILKKFGLFEKAVQNGLKEWKLPFLVLKGRTDVAVTFYALNIFPEHIKSGIEHKKLSKLLSGNYFAYNKTFNKGKSQKLYLQLELAENIDPTIDIIKIARETVVKSLLEKNIEYRKLYSIIKEKALPTIELIKFGDHKFRLKLNSGILNMEGKKPRVILPNTK